MTFDAPVLDHPALDLGTARHIRYALEQSFRYEYGAPGCSLLPGRPDRSMTSRSPRGLREMRVSAETPHTRQPPDVTIKISARYAA